MTEPLWCGKHGRGAMARHKDDLRAEAGERQAAYDERHKVLITAADAKLLSGEPVPLVIKVPVVIEEPKRTRRRRNITRQHKAHTD